MISEEEIRAAFRAKLGREPAPWEITELLVAEFRIALDAYDDTDGP